MTLTRSKTGVTPKKPEHPDYVETPRARRPRKSMATTESPDESDTPANGHANGSAGAVKAASPKTPGSKPRGRPRKNKAERESEESEGYEFGGPWGVTAIMIGFPLLMWYMWIGATYYDGKFPVPAANQGYGDFAKHLVHLAYTGAFPTLKAWAIYWIFFVFEMVCYLYVPGVYSKGKPLEHLGGKQLDYYCSGQLSLWVTIAVAGALHYTGLFKLYTLIDEFGPIMSVAIFSGIIVSVVAYVSAFARGATHRMTGNHVYDFFMGAELNPRMFTWLDFKMFFEVRLPWYILFLCSLGACARQYEQYGYVSGELYFLLMAHFLYANACGKGEELIPPTWDMYYEKWGFMLIFWNMAGVPLSYCHCIIHLSNHSPDTYRWNRGFLTFLYISYLFVYWIWDTCGSQKNYFRSQQNGTTTDRIAFPTLPFRHVENPQTIPVPGGKDLLADGWYKYARKIHYTCDTWFAICWALVTGFSSPFPWFYPVFFVIMIAHRAQRDIQKCRERYGEAWKEFERRTPYLFIPYVI